MQQLTRPYNLEHLLSVKLSATMGTPRYWIWSVKPIGSNVVLMAALGTKKDIIGYWRGLTERGWLDIPIPLYQLMNKHGARPRMIKYEVLLKCKTLVEAHDQLRVLRSQHPFAIVRDFGTQYR